MHWYLFLQSFLCRLLIISELVWFNSDLLYCMQICQFAEMNPDAVFLQVNYETHKSMCYSLNVHVLPFFRFYRGAQGRLCSFSCTNATVRSDLSHFVPSFMLNLLHFKSLSYPFNLNNLENECGLLIL